ncbi:hydroxymethylbilane synthase [Erythrobacter sanguineus]|uniref:Hydroxymethylbilane synthase n=1 Tax=Erythrobacter sanguineus TaxID=198312 RepID=A0A1M7S3R5_9SPHN|nr:hydroxymethylbilane synthase [Erythrobacter sanguineus]SHN53061.1 hydroxymethylbilane synthase [Erythrobacter sanguineus]
MNEASRTTPRIRLGTRNSPLAMAQAVETAARLCAAHGWTEGAVELVPVLASGDKVLDRPLSEIGGKALWTKELDQWLGEGRIDASVHSAKDVETIRPSEFHFPAFLPRADRRDSLVGAASIAAIPHGAIVGTSAPRRASQLLNLRPDCKVVTFRGNVATRLGKLEAGEADVTFLAAAGLERLGQSAVGHPLGQDEWIPAAAQGVIAIECLAANAQVTALLAAIDHAPTRAELEAERALLAELGGTCHSPVAVLCQTGDGEPARSRLSMRAALFSPDGTERIEGTADFAPGDHAPVRALAADLLARATPGIAPHFRAQNLQNGG